MKVQTFALLSLIIIIMSIGILSPANAQDAPKAVLFVGSPGGGDAILIEHLQGLGLEVIVQDAEAVTPEDAEKYSMIYISESISSGDIGDRLNQTTTPMMSSEHYLSDDMGIAGDLTDEDYGQTERKYQQVTIVDAQHPLAAGFSGDVQVYKKNGKFSFTKPGGDVQIIATFPEDPEKALVYAYEKDAKNLNGDTISQRRVFFFLFAAQESKLTEDGWKMFDAAVNWCLEVNKPTTLAAEKPSEQADQQELATSVPPLATDIPSEGLVAYWNFEENSGTTVADSSGLGHSGTFQNMDATAWTTGVAGYGLGFDGTDDQILIPHQDDLNFADEDFTLSFWIVQFNHENSGRYIVKGSWNAPKSGKRYEVFHHSSGEVRFSIDDDSVKSRVQLPDDEFVTGNWVHVVAVRDTANDELRLYANGELKGSAVDETGDISQDEEMFIGGTVDENSFFDGFMDEVAIYNRVLSEEEILALYTSAPEQKLIPENAEGQTAEIQRLQVQGTPPEPFTGTPAFPGAQGWGMGSQGGRSGVVYKVTNLNDNGLGSLREAIEASGPRIVIFEVSGTIELESEIRISEDFITIAGQTAPGDGITLKNFPVRVAANHVIIRYLRVRLGDESRQETDAIWVAEGSNIILDHCSTSWSVDETLSVSQGFDPSQKLLDNVTVQWSIISESLNRSLHAKGDHGYGSLVRGHDGSKFSFHHNLWAHHRARMPRPGNYEPYDKDPIGALMDFRNNVFYNWGGTRSGYNADSDSISQYNFINNYYVPGPNSEAEYAFDEACTYAKAYFAGNYMDHEEPDDPWVLVSGWSEGEYRLASPAPAGTISTESAPEAYQRILKLAGASKARDSVDQRVVDDVKNTTGKIIDNPSEVGGWPELKSEVAPVDSDNDGMPDAWEEAQGLNKDDNNDGNLDQDGDGYTNIEEYLNSLVPEE